VQYYRLKPISPFAGRCCMPAAEAKLGDVGPFEFEWGAYGMEIERARD
jgi:hypothetical protein